MLVGAVLAAFTRPWIGLVVGAATGVAVMVTRLGGVLTGGAVGLMIAAGAVVVVDQVTHPVQAGGTWAPTFSTAAILAWAAVACLAADAFVELRHQAAERAARRNGFTDDPPDRRSRRSSDGRRGPGGPGVSTTRCGPSA